jgi:Trypsin-like peptidase domain
VALAAAVAGLGPASFASRQTSAPPAQAGGVAAAEPQFRPIRSVSGTKGSPKNGQFVMEDPRTVFYLPEDKQVIVYFEWEGSLGPHHLEGYWKNPEGKVVVISDFNYESKQKRFGAYWTLTLSDAMAPGIWALEAHVDGEVAGTHNFQIVTAPRPALPPPPRPELSASDIYKLVVPAVVSVEKLDEQRRRMRLGSGFVLAREWVVTTFDNIDSAALVRVVLADGRTTDLDGAAAWNHREDWAVLRLPTSVSNSLQVAKADSWQVGDPCFSIDSPHEGNRTIREGAVTGTHAFPDVGERMNLNFGLSPAANGSPVVNEYGEVIGIAAFHSLVPGLGSLDAVREGNFPAYPPNLFSGGSSLAGDTGMAIPISAIQLPSADAIVKKFSDLQSSGEFAQPLVRDDDFAEGAIGRSIQREGGLPQVIDERFEFQRKDGSISVLATWRMQRKFRGSAFLRIYNIDNKPMGFTKPAKLNFSKNQVGFTSWSFEIAHWATGLYRIDLVVDSDPVWRSFFRLTD